MKVEMVDEIEGDLSKSYNHTGGVLFRYCGVKTQEELDNIASLMAQMQSNIKTGMEGVAKK